MRLKIHKFDPSQLKPHRTILIVARRGSGKSVLCEDLMYHMRASIDMALAMTPTEDSAQMFAKHLPLAWVYDHFDQSKLEQMINLQRGLAASAKQRSLLLILDDCMYDKKILRSEAMRALHYNGRHNHITYMSCLQYLMDVGPELRSNIDYVFVLREPVYANQVKLYKYFFGIFPNFTDFQTVLTRCTENYSCLVLDNTATSNSIDECVSWYRANPKLPDFKIGKPIYWKLASEMARNDKEREQEASERLAVKHLENRDRQSRKQRITSVVRHDKSGKALEEDVMTVVV